MTSHQLYIQFVKAVIFFLYIYITTSLAEVQKRKMEGPIRQQLLMACVSDLVTRQYMDLLIQRKRLPDNWNKRQDTLRWTTIMNYPLGRTTDVTERDVLLYVLPSLTFDLNLRWESLLPATSHSLSQMPQNHERHSNITTGEYISLFLYI